MKRATALRRELPSAIRIPYRSHVSRHVVRTESGEYVQVFRLAGASFESADDEVLRTWPSTCSKRPPYPPTLGEVLRQGMASDAEGFSAHWKRIIASRQTGRFPLSAPCVRAISDIIDLAPVTASAIRMTFTNRLDLFANPLIDAATSFISAFPQR